MPGERIGGVTGLADLVSTPDEVSRLRAAAARRPADDARAPTDAIIDEVCGLAALGKIGDGDEPVLCVPGVAALPITQQIAVRIIGLRLAGEIGELIEGVAAGVLVHRSGRCLGTICRFRDRCELVLALGRESKIGILACAQSGVVDTGKPAISRVRQIRPRRLKRGTRTHQLSQSDLVRLPQIADGKIPEITQVIGDAPNGIVLIGFCAGP